MASLSPPRTPSHLALLPRSLRAAALATLPCLLAACSGAGSGDKVEGQTEFTSAPPPGASFGNAEDSAAGGSTGGSAPPAAPSRDSSSAQPRTVEETDLYRVEDNRLYYLSGYRGLLVFDITNIDAPRLLGRSPIFGHPVEMVVRGGIATVVVADWYGTMEDGSPFHGSIVRGLDARDPANIRALGEAKLGGWVRDTRVVGDVLYAVSQDYGWSYGWYGEGAVASSPAGGGGGGRDAIVVSSVSFGGGVIAQKGQERFEGYGGVFHVTPASILFAREVPASGDRPWHGSGRTELQYIDITDPAGTIQKRGSIQVAGSLQAWGTDNGRWNLDFADGRIAHVVGCGSQYCGGPDSSVVLATADFTNPSAPTLASELRIQSTGWAIAARFAGTRLYLSPSAGYYDDGSNAGTPIQIYDLANPSAPMYAGQVRVPGSVWNFTPAGDRLFALGGDASARYGSSIAVRYLDVTNPTTPKVLGSATFGEGWAWTPAAGTFKAFAKNDAEGLVALPFSGWSAKARGYNNGVQLIEFTADTMRTAGAAKARGWVERGVFVKGRVLSMSDQALAVIDYTNRDAPVVKSELVLARNVHDVRPVTAGVAELSSDWWGNDASTSELRVVPTADVEHDAQPALAELAIEGTNARAFPHGDLQYVVTTLTKEVPCEAGKDGGGRPAPEPGWEGTPTCTASTERVTVVDLAGGNARIRGQVDLPQEAGHRWGWGYYGCYWYDWYNGADVVAVGDALALRRTRYSYDPASGKSDTLTTLYVVDAKNPDAPQLAAAEIVPSSRGWWGSMRAANDKLYTTHYEWVDGPRGGFVKYYLDEIDLSDRAAPKIGKRINVPGFLVGTSETDPNEIYTVDYRWYDQGRGYVTNDFNVLRLDGGVARLMSTVRLDGWVGNVFVRGKKAYTSIQRYQWEPMGDGSSSVRLAEIDLTNPRRPVVRGSAAQRGWGWLLGVEGDRAILTSGWGQQGIDIYKLGAGAPTFESFVRTRGWWTSDLARQGNRLLLASGYWGVQAIDLPR